MLILSDTATTLITSLVDRQRLPEGSGLRIATAAYSPNDLQVSTATTPEDGDEVIEDKGARVFLESEAAALLEHQVLDARVDDRGSVHFMLASQ